MPNPIKVMVSSRCDSSVTFSDGTLTLSELRKEIKTILESEQLLEQQSFDVWINEHDTAAASANEDAWEHCLNQAASAEIFICLFNGEAGWGLNKKDVGICHAELEMALRTGRSKVCAVTLPYSKGKKTAGEVSRNKDFQDYFNKQKLYRGSTIQTRTDAINLVKKSVVSQLFQLARRGKASSKADKYDRGEALNWNRLSFVKRKEVMESTLLDYFIGNGGSDAEGNSVCYKINNKKVHVHVSAIPAALTISEAKELVGRPQLQDHVLCGGVKYNKVPGPIHIIACHRNITETQALSVLGFPDAVIIKSGFGVYVADNIQKCQLVFFDECRDSVSTKHKAQMFFDWLELSDEGAEMLERANARRKIIAEIVKHAKTS